MPTTQSVDIDTLRVMATNYTSAWSSQNPGAVASFFAVNGSLTVNRGTPAVGREAIAAVARGFMTAFPDLVILMDDLALNPERAYYHWTLLGTHGVTGRKVRISGFEVWELNAEGLIEKSEGHFDEQAYQKQLAG